MIGYWFSPMASRGCSLLERREGGGDFLLRSRPREETRGSKERIG